MQTLRSIERKLARGQRLDSGDARLLYESPDIHALGRLARREAFRRHGDRVTFVRNRHVNPTNICENRCRFCAFSRSAGDVGAFELTMEEILARAGEAAAAGAVELHIVGGLHPDRPFSFYTEMLSAIRAGYPGLHLKGFTAVEIDFLAKKAGLDLDRTVAALREAGLGSLPGGGAEILGARVRRKICPEKISGSRWLRVMEVAHRGGLRSNATMLYGHVESVDDRIAHLRRLRELQDRTGGFNAFIPLPFHPDNTRIPVSRRTPPEDDLRTIAVSRLFLDNIPHIKAYWVMLGTGIAQIALEYGADDMDGTVVEEKISAMAGRRSPGTLTTDELVHLIRRAGRTPVERDALYHPIRVWNGE